MSEFKEPYQVEAEKLLRVHEGRRKKIYKDSLGIPTIGIGRNLDGKGLSDDEIEYLFKNDLRDAEADARSFVGEDCFSVLTPTRKAVLIDMAFNLGLVRLSQFKTTRSHIRGGRYEKAAQGMLDSKWAAQVGDRANMLARLMQDG